MGRLARYVVVCCLVASPYAQSPTPPSQQPVFRTGVDIVQLDVTVLDRRTRLPVTGLEASDFTLLEDGQPRPIVGFTPITLPAPPPTTASWTTVAPDTVTNVVPEGRLVVAMFADTIAPGRQAVAARRIAATVFDHLGPDDRAAVLHMTALAESQNFTADRSRLLRAAETNAIGVNRGGPGACPCGICVHDAIRDVANALSDAGARQKLLFFIGNNILLEPDPADPCAATQYQAIREMFAAAQRANLVVYPVSPAGVTTPDEFSAARRADGTPVAESQLIADPTDSPMSLRDLAAETGGRAVVRDNEPTLEIPALLAETDAYYLLAFTPAEGPDDGRPRRIEVTVNRPGIDVRTRRSYYPPRAEKPASPTAVVDPRQLPPALARMLPTPAIPLAMSLTPLAPTMDGRVTVAVVVGVERPVSAGMSAGTLGSGDTIGLRAMAFDTRGREQASARARIGPIGDDERYTIVARLDLRPGRYEVRTAVEVPGVEDASSVYGYVEVPDIQSDRLSLSGPFVTTEPGDRTYLPADLEALLPAVPTAQRTLTSDDRTAVILRVYQGRNRALRPATVTLRILDIRDAVVAEQQITLDAERFAKGRHADATFGLPVARLPAGEYLLRLTATLDGPRPPAALERTVRFRVR